ncbi:sporulation protein YunB [Heyndrickxia sp. NPDC080065]|uniref:sporulation protein YunB n=1 Tax=Heyndrickxia sp. NPDC080065 TaxID=3390568 RepID=UPI003D01BA9A
MVKFRPHKSRRGPLPLRYVILLTFVFFIFSTVGGLWIVNKGIKPILVRYAESQNQKIAANAVNYAVEEIAKKDINEILKVVLNEKGNVSYVEFQPGVLNKITAEVQQLVQSYLNGAEEGDIQDLNYANYKKDSGELVYSIPLGRATNNVLLGNLGPDIPIKFHVIGDTKVNMDYDTEEKGINSTHVKLSIQVKVNVQTIIPFSSKITEYDQTIPLPGGVYKGDVPLYNSGNGNESPPSIQLENEKNK